MARGGQGLQVVIDPLEWYRLKGELDKFDPALAKALRKRIKGAGDKAADEVRATLRLPAPGSGSDSDVNARAALIAATRVSVSFGKKAAGAKITTGSSKLSAEHKGFLNVYNKKTFRHPVFGNRSVFVPQEGRPYFRASIYKVLDKALINEIRAALDEATAAIGGRTK